MAPILEVENLGKSFGAVVVADKLSLSLAKGEALGIIGPNGAGKTSLFNMVAGVMKPTVGRVLLEGADITQMRPDRRCRLGIGRCFQIPKPFLGLSVFENLLVAAAFGRTGGRDAEARSVEALGLTGLARKANTLAGSLTLLERKRLELARALAGQPTLLLLDEIAGGLTPHECEDSGAGDPLGARDRRLDHLDRTRRACAARHRRSVDGAASGPQTDGRRAARGDGEP